MCFIQVGAGGLKALVPQQAPMTMDEILGVLVSKAHTEAEEGQRLLISALNGLAGLMLLQGEPQQAVSVGQEGKGGGQRRKQ